MLRDFARRLLFRYLEIPSQDDFDQKDAAQIREWLSLSSKHRGFHAYCKARDRRLAQAIISSPISSEAERSAYHQLVGARLEISRLYNRAQNLTKKLSKEEDTPLS